ncbi:NAD(P)-binding protein [Gonapodya prolifera JEL478]|uniref:NAD(P)-binding protein n=1 Tax=Gonapodya prolifera (strain JEL478) TaxID=1344416 RepID=A0A139ATN4_GONPJ|nr:NAD(P)-binding protein [Gonapodya prolifera JEL478]|eukprot:KXS20054.1 NAD(P)-binding protein [Gonapodya prolifera JEL478]
MTLIESTIATIDALFQQAADATEIPKWAVGAGAAAVTALVGASLWPSPRRLSRREGLGIVITGCDTGFGRVSAVNLAKKGFTVYAGCLFEKSIAELNAEGGGNIIGLKMDVTSDAEVSAAVAAIEKTSPGGIYALLNNAGIQASYKWELTPMDMIQKDMDVNYYGVVRVTKALLPLLRRFANSVKSGAVKSQLPRIITVTSLAAWLPVQPLDSYASSKHAVQAFGITLRQEIKRQGILYSSVEPYHARTPIVTNVSPAKINRIIESNSTEVLDAYGGEASIRKKMGINAAHMKFDDSDLIEPEVVMDRIIDQIELAQPEYHALVGSVSYLYSFVVPRTPSWLLDEIAISIDDF